MKSLKKESGFTIIEIVMAISLFSIFVIGTGAYIANAFKDSNYLASKLEIENSVDALMNNIERIVKMAGIPVLSGDKYENEFIIRVQATGKKYTFKCDGDKVIVKEEDKIQSTYEYIEKMEVERQGDNGIKITLVGKGNKYSITSTYYTRNTM